tara:strand:- start:6888 stop:7730 length:843 start_codon:yes stop_codon:yes gene_type:complete
MTIAQDYKSYTYFENESISLNLDLFMPINITGIKTPLLIYVHGGGFKSGDRADGHDLARHLASQNIACASISYTLNMKNQSFSCDGKLSEKIKAIQVAASQLWHATSYLVGKSDLLNIDSSQIFLGGNSAGAETVLHAAYWNREQMQLYNPKLLPGFEYAGVISGAGAIMDLNLITEENKIPLMAFHGDADTLVPYGTAAHHYCTPNSSGWLMLFGSYSIVQHLHNIDGTYQLITFSGGGHSYAGAYIDQDQQLVADFIKNVVLGKRFKLHEVIGASVQE